MYFNVLLLKNGKHVGPLFLTPLLGISNYSKLFFKKLEMKF